MITFIIIENVTHSSPTAILCRVISADSDLCYRTRTSTCSGGITYILKYNIHYSELFYFVKNNHRLSQSLFTRPQPKEELLHKFSSLHINKMHFCSRHPKISCTVLFYENFRWAKNNEICYFSRKNLNRGNDNKTYSMTKDNM